MLDTNDKTYAAVNPCRLCTPLGACLAFKGIRNCMPLIHGSQGCATYIRRFMISHFREPVDIASSSFTEETAIFGGERNLLDAFSNVISQYEPEVIGIATSCLSEIIGDDIEKIIHINEGKYNCKFVSVSTPSFKSDHCSGFHATVKAIVKTTCTEVSDTSAIFIAPPIVSPADLRYIKNVCREFYLNPVLIPDYSDTLDGGTWNEYVPLPEGGTPVNEIRKAASSESTFIEIGSIRDDSAGDYLKEKYHTKSIKTEMPVGIAETDRFIETIAKISGKEIPEEIKKSRLRCIDSYIDGHKYVSGLRVVIYGDEDLAPAMFRFCMETGLKPVLCASDGQIKTYIEDCMKDNNMSDVKICDYADFSRIESMISELSPDLIIGSGKGNHISIKYGIPLIRIGFPVHDRFGAVRQLHLGYEGAMQILDKIINTVLSGKQENIPDGYSYL